MQISLIRDWEQHPVTKILLRQLKQQKHDILNNSVEFISNLDSQKIATELKYIMGKVALIDEIVSLDILQEELQKYEKDSQTPD